MLLVVIEGAGYNKRGGHSDDQGGLHEDGGDGVQKAPHLGDPDKHYVKTRQCC